MLGFLCITGCPVQSIREVSSRLHSSSSSSSTHTCPSSETLGQSVGSGEKAARKFQVRAKELLGTDSHNCTTTRENPNFTFCEGSKQAMTKFIIFMNLDMLNRNSAPEEFACI